MRFPWPGSVKRVSVAQNIFSRIYEQNEWLAGSGEGSLPKNTRAYRVFLQRFLQEHAIRSVLDLGCGDWQLGSLIDWEGIDYVGVDVVPAVIERNRSLSTRSHVRFLHADGLDDELPGADLLLAKDVLQHWPNETIQRFLLTLPQYQYALITNCYLAENNQEIPLGGCRGLALLESPFNMLGREVLRYTWYSPHSHLTGWKQVILWERPGFTAPTLLRHSSWRSA